MLWAGKRMLSLHHAGTCQTLACFVGEPDVRHRLMLPGLMLSGVV